MLPPNTINLKCCRLPAWAKTISNMRGFRFSNDCSTSHGVSFRNNTKHCECSQTRLFYRRRIVIPIRSMHIANEKHVCVRCVGVCLCRERSSKVNFINGSFYHLKNVIYETKAPGMSRPKLGLGQPMCSQQRLSSPSADSLC